MIPTGSTEPEGADTIELGSLEPETLMLNLALPPSVPTGVHDAWQGTTLNHELRHFHDLIGSEAGFALLLNTIDAVQGFYHALAHLAALGFIRAPLTRWAQRPTAPEIVRQFVRFYRTKYVMTRIGTGDFTSSVKLGHQETAPVARAATLVGETKSAAVDLPFLANPMVEMHSGKSYIVQWPIGFRTLTEGNAFNIQAFMTAVHIVGPGTASGDEYWKRIGEQINRIERALRSQIYPYLVTRKICASFFAPLFTERRRTGKPLVLGGNLELALSDLALMVAMPRASSLDRFLETFDIRQPGAIFVSAVAKAKEILERDKNRSFPLLELLDNVCDEMSWNRYSLIPSQMLKRWEHERQGLSFDRGLTPSLTDRIAKKLADWHISVLKTRIQNPYLMIDPLVYLRKNHLLPSPRVTRLGKGELGLKSSRDTVWIKWIMILHLMHLLFDGVRQSCLKQTELKAFVMNDKQLDEECKKFGGICPFIQDQMPVSGRCIVERALRNIGLKGMRVAWIYEHK